MDIWLQKKLSKILPPGVLLELGIVFLVIFGGMLVEVYIRILRPHIAVLTGEMIRLFFWRSLIAACMFTFLYRLGKWGFLTHIIGRLGEHMTGAPQKTMTQKDILLDGYTILAASLGALSLRPILQKVIPLPTGMYADNAFVKYDASQIFFILACVGIPLALFIMWREQGKEKWIKIFWMCSAAALAIFVNRGPNYLARMYEARAAWAAGEFVVEEKKSLQAIADAGSPEEKARAYYWLGVAKNRQGDAAAAVEAQRKAIELDPSYAAPLSSLSLAYTALGKREEAISAARRCIEKDSTYAWCHYALAVPLYNNGQYKEGMNIMQQAHNLDPLSPDINRALESMRSSRKDSR